MKKLFFATGITLILVGAVLAAMYSTPVTVKARDMIAQEYKVWQISANFTAGDKIIGELGYASSWTQDPWDLDDLITFNHRHIWFYIDDPEGNSTEFNTAWSGHGLTTGQLALVYINVTVQNSTYLYIPVTAQNSTYPTYIGGVALLTGTYTFRCDPEMEPTPSNVTAPAWMSLSREYPNVTSPYTSFLPIGISVSGVGAVISIATWRGKKKTASKKRT